MIAQIPTLMGLFVVLVALIVFMAAAVTMIGYAQIWFQAYMANLPISLIQVLVMSFRKINPRPVVSALIIAKQAGITLSCQEVELAYMQGADVQKIAAALVAANQGAEKRDFTFQQLVDTDLEKPV